MNRLGLPSSTLHVVYLCAFFAFASTWMLACQSDDGASPPMSEEDGPDEADELPVDVSVKVGAAGGTVKAKGVTLEIPAGALGKDVVITTKNRGKTAPSKKLGVKQVSDLYEFGPKGTTFSKEVTVSFGIGKSDDKAVVYFTKENSTEFEKVATTTKGATASAKVRHFSQGFAGIPAAEDTLDAGGETLPPDASFHSDAGTDAQVPPDVEKKQMFVLTQDASGVAVTPSWAAFQDGDGPFQYLPTPNETGRYGFEIENAKFAVIFVCADPIAGTSTGSGFYRTAEVSGNHVVRMSGAACMQEEVEPVTHEFTAQVTQNGLYSWRAGQHSWTSAINFSATTSVDVKYTTSSTPTDLLFAAGVAGYQLSRFLVVRNVVGVAAQTQAYDLATDGAALDAQGSAQVTNATAGTSLGVVYTTRNTFEGLMLETALATGSASTRSVPFAVPPPAVRAANDRFLLHAEDMEGDVYRSVKRASALPADMNARLPDLLDVTFGAETASYARPVFDFAPQVEVESYEFFALFAESRTVVHDYTLDVDAAWFGPSAERLKFVFPDLSAVQGFQTGWVKGGADPGSTGIVKSTARWTTAAGGSSTWFETRRTGEF